MPKVLIGPCKEGIRRDLEPMWLPNEAFVEMEDLYVFRGRIRKKSGYSLLGRLNTEGATAVPVAAGNINSGDFTFNYPGLAAGDLPLMPGSLTVTITVGGAWPAVLTFQDNGNGTLTCTDPTALPFVLGYGIVDYLTGEFDLYIDPVMPVGGPFPVTITAFRQLEQNPCTGLGLYEQAAVNQEDLIAFDENHSYLYNSATQMFDPLDDGAGNIQTWNGDDHNFFWTANYYQDSNFNYLFWATNNIANSQPAAQVQDGIQIFNGTAWEAQNPQVDATPTYLRGCLILIPFKSRMIALNTLEGDPIPAAANRYPNRARWSQNGVPYTTTIAGADANAWRHDIVGRGGYIDAPTREAITSASYIKDSLIVFFERSTWQLRYTGSEILPFVWEQINAELGSESPFSSVPFDTGILSVGDKGIIAADSVNVQRIDEKLPDIAFEIHNDDEGPARVHGIRDFYKKLVYWCYPSDISESIFPDKVLCLNHEEGSYSIFNDTFTCFGYWQSTRDYTWDTLSEFGINTWDEWDIPWNSPVSQSYFPSIVAGNQCGNVLRFNASSVNGAFGDLTNITNAAPAVVELENHALNDGQFVRIQYTRGFEEAVVDEAVGIAPAGSTSFQGSLANMGIFPASAPTAAGPHFATITIGALQYTDLGDGTLLEAATGTETGIINYETGTFTLDFPALGADTPITASYSYNILNFRVFYITWIDADTFNLFTINTAGETEALNLAGYPAPYAGWGEVSQVSNFKLKTKRFNPYLPEGTAFRMLYFDTLLDSAPLTFLSNIYADHDSTTPTASYSISCFDNETSMTSRKKLWQRTFASATSDFVQLEFEIGRYEMTQYDNYASPFALHSIIFESFPAGRNINRS
jgi:hypothetical protein